MLLPTKSGKTVFIVGVGVVSLVVVVFEDDGVVAANSEFR